MKKIPTKEAVGAIICHDITQIIPGEFKGAIFKKGHVIKEEDIPVLLSLGKDHIYVWEKKQDMLHEDEAALRLKEIIKGSGIKTKDTISEGKINFYAMEDGLFKINTDVLNKINSLGEIIISTIPNNIPVESGTLLGSTRVVPLVIHEERIKDAERIAKDKKIISVKPYKNWNIGMVVTGNEIYYERITDKFSPVVINKLMKYGKQNIKKMLRAYDDVDKIKGEVEKLINAGCDLIICTGGMSVDPDDLTPKAIKEICGELVTYGVPVLPGGMFLLAYYNDIPIMGLPGCVMYSKTTIFDLVLPRVLAGEKINKEELRGLGVSGLCLNCDVCRYPYCNFGKGW